MRRLLKTIPVLILALTFTAPAAGFGDSRFDLCLTGNAFFSADSAYGELYGDVRFLPSLSASFSLNAGVFVWADLGFLSGSGNIDELNEACSVNQLQSGAGLGWRALNKGPLRVSVSAGVGLHYFSEEAMDRTNSAFKAGFRLGSTLDYAVSRKLFVRIAAAWSTASRSQTWDNKEIQMKLGGFSLGGGIGYAF